MTEMNTVTEINEVVETNTQFYTMAELCELFKVGRATINRWNNPSNPAFKPHFPQPFKMSMYPLWDKSEIEAFIEFERKARDEEIAKRLDHQVKMKKHRKELRETLFEKQRATKSQRYIRPEKGERLSAHTIRKIQAYNLQ